MIKKSIRPKAKREPQQTDDESEQDSSDDQADAENSVGVHIIGKQDLRRHFGTGDDAADVNKKPKSD